MKYYNINTVALGDMVTDGEGNFASVKWSEEEKSLYYANYFPTIGEIDCTAAEALTVTDFYEDHLTQEDI